MIFALMYVYVINIFQAFLKAWEAVCKGGRNTKILVPQGKTFMLKPLAFIGPCKSSSISFSVYIYILDSFSSFKLYWEIQPLCENDFNSNQF